MKQIKEMTKDELEVYAKENYGVDIDKRTKIEVLHSQVAKLDVGKDDSEPSDATDPSEKGETQYLRNPKTSVVMVATKALLKRSDLVPCPAPPKAD